MLHPSYNDLMNVVNSDVEPGEHPVVNSRYSIVLGNRKTCPSAYCRFSASGIGKISKTSQYCN